MTVAPRRRGGVRGVPFRGGFLPGRNLRHLEERPNVPAAAESTTRRVPTRQVDGTDDQRRGGLVVVVRRACARKACHAREAVRSWSAKQRRVWVTRKRTSPRTERLLETRRERSRRAATTRAEADDMASHADPFRDARPVTTRAGIWDPRALAARLPRARARSSRERRLHARTRARPTPRTRVFASSGCTPSPTRSGPRPARTTASGTRWTPWEAQPSRVRARSVPPEYSPPVRRAVRPRAPTARSSPPRTPEGDPLRPYEPRPDETPPPAPLVPDPERARRAERPAVSLRTDPPWNRRNRPLTPTRHTG